MVNAQPLQARPFEEPEDQLVQVPIEVEGGSEDEYVNGGAPHEAMNVVEEVEARVNSGSVLKSRTSELTVAFEGEVYVFPAVTPEKVGVMCDCYLRLGCFRSLRSDWFFV